MIVSAETFVRAAATLLGTLQTSYHVQQLCEVGTVIMLKTDP